VNRKQDPDPEPEKLTDPFPCFLVSLPPQTMADSPQAPRAPQAPAPPPTAAALQLLLTQLGQYEPDIADEIKRAYLHLTPTHRPLLLLQSPQFRRLQAAVHALPHGWRQATRTTRMPNIYQRFQTIAANIPPELLAIVPKIVLPPAPRVRVEARARAPPPDAQAAHNGYFQLINTWQTVRNIAPPENFPIDLLNARHPRVEHRHVQLPYCLQVMHWSNPRHAHPNYTPLFASLFPTDVGRLLYAAAVGNPHYEPLPLNYHSRRRRFLQAARDYNQIKKAHTPFSPHAAKLKLARDRRWIMGLGPLKPH
jgi:hypothetical protein